MITGGATTAGATTGAVSGSTRTGSAPTPRERLAIAALSLLLFLVVHPLRMVDPTHVEWLLTRDSATHYLGWQLFRAEPWTWPPGAIRGYLFPTGTSIGLTDSIPLVAFLLKPFSSLLPAEVQYFGLWLLVSWVLSGVFAHELLRRAGASRLVAAVGSTFFSASPMLFWREQMLHPALCAHWLILAAFVVYRSDAPATRVALVLALLLVVAGLVHPYLLVTLLALGGAVVLRGLLVDRRRGLVLGGGLAAGLVASAAALYAVGVFSFGGGTGDSGFGECAADLLTFANPMSMSSLLRSFPVEPCRQEGVAYLGLGGLVVLLAALSLVGRKVVSAEEIAGAPKAWPLVLVCLLLFVFSLSSSVTVFHLEVLDLSALYAPFDRLTSALRSSGRFAWPFAYVALLWALERVARSPWAARITVLAFVLQVADVGPGYLVRQAARLDVAEETVRKLGPVPVLEAPGDVYRHVVMVPPQFPFSTCPFPSGALAPDAYVRFGRAAALAHLTFNSGFSARGDHAAIERYCRELHDALARGEVERDTIYLIADERVRPLVAAGLSCGEVGGATACVARGNDDAFARRITGAGR